VNSGVLVSSESPAAAHELLTIGRELSKQLNLQISAVSFGQVDNEEVRSYLEYGAERVLVVSNIEAAALDAEIYAYVLSEIAKDDGADIVLITSTRLGKEAAGRVAQRLQAACITDGIGLALRGSDIVVDRYALGGNTISSQIIKTRKKVITITPRTFEKRPEPVAGKIDKVEIKIPPKRVEIIERRKKMEEAVSIESAQNLVCVGKGISRKEDLTMVNELCTALKAEMGCTRALSSDYHWISEDRMVGISGKRCKPKFHVSIGVSGQIQHTVGIMGSKLIVAINKDKEAPIFRMADYGVVGDLYQVVPKLTERVKMLSR
jgi:electron transfer flavoprotein alpha subunit